MASAFALAAAFAARLAFLSSTRVASAFALAAAFAARLAFLSSERAAAVSTAALAAKPLPGFKFSTVGAGPAVPPKRLCARTRPVGAGT